MIDTHCHIYLDHFKKDLEEVLNRAADAGVTKILMPAINYDSLQQMESITHDRLVFYKMAGIHPTEINEGISTTAEELFGHCCSPDIIAVGETGLDYHWDTGYKQEQKESLRLHCRIAREVKKPVVLHNRSSTGDLLALLEEEQDGTLTGVWHCFNGTFEEGKRAIDLGFFLGIGGILTFKNAGVDETVVQLPPEKMILETDAPYLAPEPKRGRRNEPSFVKYTAEKLAGLLGRSYRDIVSLTSENARSLFPID